MNNREVINHVPGIFYCIDSNNKIVTYNIAFSELIKNIFKIKNIDSINLNKVFHENKELLFNKDCPLKDEVSLSDRNIQKTYQIYRSNISHDGIEYQNIQMLNISNRKKAEKTLIDSKDMNYSVIHEILSKIQGNVYWKDRNGVYLGCNQKQAESLGFESPSDLVGKTDFDLPWPIGSAEEFRKNDEQVMTSKKALSVEEIANIDGREVYVLSSKSPLINSRQECIGIIGISISIGDIKEAQNKLKEAKQLSDEMSRSKSDFIAALNNDLRTQMNVISMSLGGIERMGIREEHKAYYNAIEESINEMSPILEYAESYAKLDLNTKEYASNYFNPIPYVNSNIDSSYSKFIATKSDIYVDLTGYEPCNIYSTQVNFDKVIKIIINYIASISDHSHNIVEIDSITHKDTDNLLLKFIIQKSTVKSAFIKDNLYALKGDDNHISMSLIYCTKLIEDMDGAIDVKDFGSNGIEICLYLPSQESENNTKSKVDDAGKIAIVDNLESRARAIQSHIKNYDCVDYIIDSQSTLDKKIKSILSCKYIILDSCIIRKYYDSLRQMIHNNKNNYFIIYADENKFDHENKFKLPNVRKLHKHVRQDLLDKTIHELNQASKTIRNKVLVVEDSKLLRRALKLNMDVLGYDSDLVSSGEEAIELVKEYDYYAVFLDIGLPGINGLNAAKVIKDIKPGLNLIALTGLTLSIDIDKLWDAGLFKDVLKKPATLSMLELLLDSLGKGSNIIDL